MYTKTKEMKKLKHITEVCRELYEDEGSGAVYDHANEVIKKQGDSNVHYRNNCKGCEANTPSWHDTCLICGQTTKPIPKKTNVQKLEVWVGMIPEIHGYGLNVMEFSEAEAKKTLRREFLKMQKAWNGEFTFPKAMEFFGGRIFKIESGKAYYDNFGE